MKNSKLLSNSTFNKILLLVLFPFVTAIFFLICSIIICSNNYKQSIKEQYALKLQNLYQENEVSLQSVSNSLRLVTNNTPIMNVVLSSPNISDNDIKITNDYLKQVMNSYSFVDSIILYDRTNNYTYTTNGNMGADSFFSQRYIYENYDINYWSSYKSPLSEKAILSPTFIYSDHEKKIVVPIVFTRVNNEIISNLIIVNVDISTAISEFNSKKLTPNSYLQIINRQTHQIFDENGLSQTISDELYKNIYMENTTVIDYKINGKKSLIIFYAPSNSILGYTYAAIVPYKDINDATKALNIILTIFTACSICILIFMVFFSAKHIYQPIDNILLLFSGSKKNNNDSIGSIRDSITELIQSNKTLQHEMSTVLPLAQEHYLTNLLNSKNQDINDADNNMLYFEHNYFCSVVVNINFTDEYYESFPDNVQRSYIDNEINTFIISSFRDKFNAYVIPTEANSIYVLINLPDDNFQDEIEKISSEIINAFERDSTLMQISVQSGGIFEGVSGLKKSHMLALEKANKFFEKANSHFIHLTPQVEENNPFVFDIKTENQLFNFLLVGNITDSIELIDKLIEENKSNNISDSNFIQLYVNLFNTVFKVFRTKKIKYDDENIGDIAIISKIISMPQNSMHSTLLSFIDYCKSLSADAKFDFNDIIQYIQNHYTEDISLDELASRYNLTVSYISKKIKELIGMNFVDYLATLRINDAKEMLVSSSKSINDIYEEVGFNHRNSFERTFKKYVGVSASSYRKEHKK